MLRPLRLREAILAIGVLFSAIGSPGVEAAQVKLVTKCQEPRSSAGGATVTCDVRANGFAVFSGVKAAPKGHAAELETKFQPFESANEGLTTAYLIQLLPNARRTTLSQMGDAVVTFADHRGNKRRFIAYTFADDLTLVSDSGASKNEFARQVIAVKSAPATIQLYKSALQAIEALGKESGNRKALVILGDGTSNDTSYSHDQVVTAARDAGVTIHVLGFYDDRAERPKFQKLSRLAEDTGGYAVEVKQGTKDLAKDVITSRFASEVLENGGTVEVALAGEPGSQTVELAAELADGQTLKTEMDVAVPAAAVPSFETTLERAADPKPGPSGGFMNWVEDNSIPLVALGALLGLGIVGFMTYGRGLLARGLAAPSVAADASGTSNAADVQEEQTAEALRDSAQAEPAIYGWLEVLDGTGRHPLRTTNVRVGRHRDNDICLLNDSISRRHAVLHYNADTRRFVITDLGGGNGVLVNKTKYKSRELNDGDTVELGEVRLRFRAETEFST
ncbi:FHA domain-containing protein [Hyphomicrobium sp.]|uniref:FHA domain-containing protein n=1 Tax=Hyphomicrobium sp. TaxID=82 RepID=UPI002E2EC511|nr:FHA domain-containing protein [Hyphomicrobium sp.]HEX2839720.1 FHA domain-containing protein [Hyphomicrobium sp.]